jgi:hypothetical protein
MIPLAYELKRFLARHRHRFWCAHALHGVEAAPVYLFPDQEHFDSDEVEAIARRISAAPLRLPHDEVLFEIADRGPTYLSQVAFARQLGSCVEAYLMFRLRDSRQWTDVMCQAFFRPDGCAEIDFNPALLGSSDLNSYSQCLTGIVWRALALLSIETTLREQSVPLTRRPKLARAGVKGWVYHIAEIDPHRVAAAAGIRTGTHASPRWHIRRGHWRRLRDGRRTYVRACSVGDPARGGVVKDYVVSAEVRA